ncbi:MAG TPA: tRNA lysidine(34) synthetase TilS, partial [Anaerolineae bacterium]|nr:tRNA lysidine(34) synthetase TilS [Anaerolineae bacterium]
MAESGHTHLEANTVLSRVRAEIEAHHLLAPGDAVVIGVSGGPDSLCLLHVLRTLGPELDLTLHAAHLHHGLRGADADADAAFVQAIAAEWSLPVTVGRSDVTALARGEQLAIEEAARRARYAFLRSVALDAGAHTIAVGHNADDQAETVLMHFIRGSGLAGLRGMLPLTPLTDYRLAESTKAEGTRHPIYQSTNPPISLIRPLLTIPRADILAHIAAHDLHPRFDRSNLDTTYFRNWLRLEVIPLLEEHNPGVKEVIRRTADVVADDYALIRSLLEETWPRVVVEESLPPEGEEAGGRIVFDLGPWRALPVALQRSTLRQAVHLLRRSLRNINFVHIEDAAAIARAGTTGDQSTLPRGLVLTVGYDTLTVADAGAQPALPDWPLLPAGAGPLPVAVPGVTALPGGEWLLHARLVDRDALPPGWEANADPWLAFLDADAAGSAPHLRTRRPGDRFRPLGMGDHTVKLADFLTNEKVPQAVRGHVPLLAGEGGILWVCGVRVAEGARVRDDTRRALILRF